MAFRSTILVLVCSTLVVACASSGKLAGDEPSYEQLLEVEQVLKEQDASVLFKRYPYGLSRSFWRAVERGISSGSRRWLMTVEDLLSAANDEASVGLRHSMAEALKPNPKETLAFITALPAERFADVAEICTAVAPCSGKTQAQTQECKRAEIKELEDRETSIRRVIDKVSTDEAVCLTTITRRIDRLVK